MPPLSNPNSSLQSRSTQHPSPGHHNNLQPVKDLYSARFALGNLTRTASQSLPKTARDHSCRSSTPTPLPWALLLVPCHSPPQQERPQRDSKRKWGGRGREWVQYEFQNIHKPELQLHLGLAGAQLSANTRQVCISTPIHAVRVRMQSWRYTHSCVRQEPALTPVLYISSLHYR